MKKIIKELTKLSLCYPATKYTNEEIVVIADMWRESLVNISPDVFVDACRLHREQSLWFPTLKEILDRCKDVWEARRRNIKELEEPRPDLSDEEIKANAERVREIIRKARKDKK